MATSALKKFLVLYLAPADVLAEWAKTDKDVRRRLRDEEQTERRDRS